MSATRSMIFAMRGKCSQICTPGTLVEIGLNLPRMFSGASGFMSHVSRCPGEPTRKMVMQLRIFAFFSSTAPMAWRLSQLGSERPAIAAAPTCKKLRRVWPEQSGRYSFPMWQQCVVGGAVSSGCAWIDDCLLLTAYFFRCVRHRRGDIDVLALRELARPCP